MTTDRSDRTPTEEPLAALERSLIAAYVAGAGYDLRSLHGRADEPARALLAAASQYASDVLSEVEARSHYIHTLRGEP